MTLDPYPLQLCLLEQMCISMCFSFVALWFSTCFMHTKTRAWEWQSNTTQHTFHRWDSNPPHLNVRFGRCSISRCSKTAQLAELYISGQSGASQQTRYIASSFWRKFSSASMCGYKFLMGWNVVLCVYFTTHIHTQCTPSHSATGWNVCGSKYAVLIMTDCC